MLTVPDIEIAVKDSLEEKKDLAPSFEIVEPSTQEQLNQRRMLNWFQQQVTQIASGYIGCPNNDQTMEDIKAHVLSEYGYLIDKMHCSKEDFSVEIARNEVDELAEECSSYEEYKMRHVVISGDLPLISEEEFWKRHDPSSKYQLNVNITLKPLNEIRLQTLSMDVEYA